MSRLRLLAFALTLGISTAHAQPKGNEVQIGPINTVHQVQGVAVTLPATAYLALDSNASGLSAHVRVLIGLTDLQAKIGPIIDTIPLPSDNCGHYAGDNMVARIWGKQLSVEGDAMVLTVHGDVDVWDCRENPIPNSKVEWVVEDVGIGIKTKVPKVVTWPGDPIKNKLATQPLTIRQPARIEKLTPTSLRLAFGDPNISLGGQYAFITEWLLRIFNVNLNAKAKAALEQAIDPSLLVVAIPEEIRKFNPVIERAAFGVDNGNPAILAEMTANIPAAQVTETIKKLIKPNT